MIYLRSVKGRSPGFREMSLGPIDVGDQVSFLYQAWRVDNAYLYMLNGQC